MGTGWKGGWKEGWQERFKKETKKKEEFTYKFYNYRFFLCMELVFRYFFISILALTCHLIKQKP